MGMEARGEWGESVRERAKKTNKGELKRSALFSSHSYKHHWKQEDKQIRRIPYTATDNDAYNYATYYTH